MKNRRNFIQKMIAVAGVSAIAPHSSFAIHNRVKVSGPIIGHGNFKYRVDKNWGTQPENRVPIKDCHEMVEDAKGRLIMLTNHVKNNVLIYDRSGKVIDAWTKGLIGAHGLTITGDGREQYLFITDSEQGKVLKTTLSGKVLFEIGYPKRPRIYDAPEKFKPTEVAVAPNGDFYVADGYGENYIIQYTGKGEYIRHFGGKGDGPGQFDCCHGVTVDTRNPNNPTLLITSRAKQEFKRFTMDGRYLETIKLPGCSICRPVIKGENLYFAVIVTESWWAYDGMVAVLDKNNRVVSLPGGKQPQYVDGVMRKGESDLSTFLNPHDVCVDRDENLYIPQWYSGKTYPVKLQRIQD